MIYAILRNINRLFIYSFKNGVNDHRRDCCVKYYMSLVEIGFNALIDNKPFFDQLIKNKKKEAFEKLFEMSRNNDYTTGNLLDYLCHQEHYKLFGIDLSKQTNATIFQQINVIGNLEKIVASWSSGYHYCTTSFQKI